MPTKPTVLITGAAGGLGRAVVEKFLDEGWEVIATDLRANGFDTRTEGLTTLKLDVTDSLQVETVRDRVEREYDRLDVLINAAGILDFFPLSEAPPEWLKRSFDINAFGPVAMIRAFLPLLIKSGGRVINISSESVRFPGAFQPYQPSKMALEGLHRTLRQELSLKGVKMIVIRPGAIDTGMTASVLQIKNPVKESLYLREFDVFASMAAKFVGRKTSPEKVAKLIYRAASAKSPRYYYHINHSVLLTFLSKLPQRFQDRMTLRMFKKRMNQESY